MLRLHSLYPTPGPQMAKLAPDLEIGHLHIVKKKKESCVKDDWVRLRSCIKRNKHAKFGTLTKRQILSAKAVEQKGRVPSLLEFYLTLYTVQLSEDRLRVTKEKLIFLLATTVVSEPPRTVRWITCTSNN